MPNLRIMTFNVENLLSRFNFKRTEEEGLVSLPDADDPAERAELVRNYWNILNDENRVFTALTIRKADEAGPDVVCLMEVENMAALKKFHDKYLAVKSFQPYPYKYLIEGNDQRGINVAVISRHRIVSVVSHQDASAEIINPKTNKKKTIGRIFRRDCLEVNVDVDKRSKIILPIFICHFKSQIEYKDSLPSGVIREAEAKTVRKIIQDRFDDPAKHDWLVVGDFNEATEKLDVKTGKMKPTKKNSLSALLDGKFCDDLVKRLPDKERWTHYYASGNEYSQLDYILASPSLAKKNPDLKPTIIRDGQPFRAELYTGPRWPRVGYDRPKASDHCPVVVELEF